MNNEIKKKLLKLEKTGKLLQLWFRDDDAARPTPKLRLLLSFFESHDVPLLLAVIPQNLEFGAVQLIRRYKQVSVGQHGYSHINYCNERNVQSELCSARGLDQVVSEQITGHDTMTLSFKDQYDNIFIPPFFEIDSEVKQALEATGFYTGFSSWGSNGKSSNGIPDLNVQIDIADWSNGGAFAGAAYVEQQLLSSITRFLHTGQPEDGAIGIVLHHELLNKAAYKEIAQLIELSKQRECIRLVNADEVRSLIKQERISYE